MVMLNVLKKGGFHIVVWALMVTYVVSAPDLYVRFVLKNGKPVQLSDGLPTVTYQISFSVDRMDPMVLDGQDLFNLWGWAFLREEPDQSQYERFIVLKSDTNTYFFQTQSADRPDVQEAFPDLTINVLNSGFSTLISKDVIQLGSYQIGIFFKQSSDNAVYYVVTNKMIVRTGNQLQLVITDEQPIDAPSGKPVQFDQELPAVTNQILISADRMDPVVSAGQDLFNLWGWAFLREEPDQSQYERFIVLKSDTNTYFFPTQSSNRPDVQEAFPDLTINVLNSGFTAFISKDVVQLGSYQIGIVFKQTSGNGVYYAVTNKRIVRTGNQLQLVITDAKTVDPPSGKPVQFDQELPETTGQISFSADRLDPIVSDGQDLFNLWGWAFLQGEPDQSQYERLVVLRSDTNTYFFPTQSFEYTGVQEIFPDLTINVLNSGFSTFISKDVVQLGSYQIGTIFRHRSSNAIYYMVTNKLIVCTGNQLQLVVTDAQP
jgi:hypothetical protein